MASTKTKGLPASKNVKGGGRKLGNDSLTLIRAARKKILRPLPPRS